MMEPELVRQIKEVLEGARQALAALNPDEVPHIVSLGTSVLIEKSLHGPATIRNHGPSPLTVYETSEREMTAKPLRSMLYDFADSI